MSGKILVGSHEGVYVLRFVGDVRVTVSGSFDRYLDAMFADPDFVSVLVDLSQAVAIDSTSLGVLAKLSIAVQEQYEQLPMMICNVPDILRILDNMGFADVFVIITDPYELQQQLAELPQSNDIDEDEMRLRVIEAHETLMSMNEHNAETFRSLVEALQAERPAAVARRNAS
ncbi:MAG: STAS domain-containing protein [bacterium]